SEAHSLKKTGIIDQDINLPALFLNCSDSRSNALPVAEIALHSDRLPAFLLYLSQSLLSFILGIQVGERHVRPGASHRQSDCSSQVDSSTGDQCRFAVQICHDCIVLSGYSATNESAEVTAIASLTERYSGQ